MRRRWASRSESLGIGQRNAVEGAVFLIRQIDLIAGNAHDVQNLVEEWVVHGSIRNLFQRRLRVESNTQTRSGEHIDVISAITDSDSLVHLQARIRSELTEELSLRSAVNDLAGDVAGQLAINDFQSVGADIIQLQLLSQTFQHLDETTGNNSGLVTHAVQRTDRGARTRGQLNSGSDLIDHRRIQTSQRLHTLTQRLLEIELTAHRTLSNCRNFSFLARVSRQHLNDLTSDQRGITIEAHQTLRTTQQTRTLNRNIHIQLRGKSSKRLTHRFTTTRADIRHSHLQLQAGHRVIRNTTNGVNVGIVIRQGLTNAGNIQRINRITQHHNNMGRTRTGRLHSFLQLHHHGLSMHLEGVSQACGDGLDTLRCDTHKRRQVQKATEH
ncbi:hypothetical protein cgR_2430 [Corynebacterium glutamicum R]|uniref:Uncharacterized protein n=1 Tax=Corynebacterium glutamicum (strain R) TaxID=340322 RepID=A0AB72VD54_CORGB|nr:hypothetical protein cgR_2430 [Corynebacterium glutamicum R]